MIDFTLTEEQVAMRRLAHDFALDVLRPIALECDRKDEFPLTLLPQAAKIGLTSYAIPSEYGGAGADAVTSALIAEELAWGCAGLSASLTGTLLAAHPIMMIGTSEQKAHYLTALASPNGCIGAVCITEPEAGSDVLAMRSRAVQDGNDYIITGNKIYITNGGIADIYIVFAITDPDQGGRSLSSFIVEGNRPGVVPGKKELKMGLCASHTGEVSFQDVRVPASQMLGARGKGFANVIKFFTASRPQVAAVALGVARAAFEAATDYAKQRNQFGMPIIANQGVGFMLADMGMKIEAARSLVWRACAAIDAGEEAGLLGSYAKAFATDVAMQVTTDAVQVLGGNGLMREYHVEKWMRDAKVLQIVEGTNQIQRLIAVSHLIKA